jgi:ribosomal protein L24E
MKKPAVFVLIFAASLSVWVVLDVWASGANLVLNGGFEQEGSDGLPRGWHIVPAYAGKGTAFRDGARANSGRFSLRLIPNEKNTSEAFGVFMMLDADKISGAEVTIRGTVMAESLGGNGAGILLKAKDEHWLIFPRDTGAKFVPFEKTLSIPKGISEAGLLILVGGTRGSLWVDDLHVGLAGEKAAREAGPGDKYLDKINTPGWQDSAFITPDGRDLYFAYMPYAQNDFLDVFFKRVRPEEVAERGPVRPGGHGMLNFETYVAKRRADGSWERPVNLNINSTYSLYSAKTSFDGKELYYAIRDFERNYGADDIYVSRRLPDGSWSPPENLGPNINSRHREDTPFLSADGKTLYFARNKGETLGWEIMKSTLADGRWNKAQRLGPPINQPGNDKTANYQPFITADGKEFYFTRIQQLYRSTRQADGGWGVAEKVFPELPVSGHASVTADGKYLYFITAKDKESLKRQHWTIWYAERQEDGGWGNIRPVD